MHEDRGRLPCAILFANLRPAVCYPALAEPPSLKREVVEGSTS
jgi:hypothetical protein